MTILILGDCALIQERLVGLVRYFLPTRCISVLRVCCVSRVRIGRRQGKACASSAHHVLREVTKANVLGLEMALRLVYSIKLLQVCQPSVDMDGGLPGK